MYWVFLTEHSTLISDIHASMVMGSYGGRGSWEYRGVLAGGRRIKLVRLYTCPESDTGRFSKKLLLWRNNVKFRCQDGAITWHGVLRSTFGAWMAEQCWLLRPFGVNTLVWFLLLLFTEYYCDIARQPGWITVPCLDHGHGQLTMTHKWVNVSRFLSPLVDADI